MPLNLFNYPKRTSFLTRVYILLILILVAIVFWPCLQNNFVSWWDDDAFLTENWLTRVLDIPHVYQIFTSSVLKVYAPLTILFFSCQRQIFGLDPGAFHAISILLHMAVVTLVFSLGRRLGLTILAAAVSAFLFGVHPMRVEVVAWVSEQKTLLYSIFYLGALIFYLQYLKNAQKKYFYLSLLAGLLSILSKAMALTLPLTLLLCDWFYDGRIRKKHLLEKIPFLLIIVPIAYITYSQHVRVPGSANLSETILIFLWTSTFYIKKFFWPFPLVPIYTLPQPVVFANWSYALSVGIFVFVLGAVVRFRNNRWFIFAVFYYVLSIFFLWRFDEGVDLNIVSDRFMYLPSLGLCFLIGIFFEKFWVQSLLTRGLCRLMAQALLAIVLGGICLITSLQSQVWRNELTLWNHVIKYSPTQSIAYLNRAIAYLALGKKDLAQDEFFRLTKTAPGSAKAFYNLGIIFDAKADRKKAIDLYTQAIQRDAQYTKAYINRGADYLDLGQTNLAFDDFTSAIKSDPQNPSGYLNRGVIYFNRQRYDEALKDFGYSIYLNPDQADALVYRAVIHSIQGNYVSAFADYAKAEKVNSQNPLLYQNRAQTYLAVNDYFRASQDVHQAQELGVVFSPEFIKSLENIRP